MKLTELIFEKRIKPIGAEKLRSIILNKLASKYLSSDYLKKRLSWAKTEGEASEEETIKEFSDTAKEVFYDIISEFKELHGSFTIKFWIIDNPWYNYKELYSDIESLITNDFLKKYGYFIHQKSSDKRNLLKFIVSPFYNDLVVDVPRYLYHSSPETEKKKILSQGIKPGNKKENLGYPDRLYFATNKQIARKIFITLMTYKLDPTDPYDTPESFVMFKIDTSKLRKGTKFYKDPEVASGESIYTYTHVPANAIKVEKEYLTNA